MSDQYASQLVVEATISNVISGHCKKVTKAEILSHEPKKLPLDEEIIIGTLDENLIKWYVCTQLEYLRIQNELYSMIEEEKSDLDRMCVELGGVFKAEALFVMGVRGYFANSFPESKKRPFQIKKGWKVVCIK